MTNSIQSNTSTRTTFGSVLQGAEIQAEVEASIKFLNADRHDLEKLLVFIKDKASSRRHFSGLLNQSYERLQKLRSSMLEFSERETCVSGLNNLISQAVTTLQTGRSFSLDITSQLLETGYDQCLKQTEISTATSLRAMQATISALKQEYNDAAERYAEAAEAPGLETTQQWQYQHESALVLIVLGREFEESQSLEKAISLLEYETINLAKCGKRQFDLATTQNTLGNAFGILGQRQRGTRNLENAVTAYQASLGNFVREKSPLYWAATQNNLGNVLGILGHRQNDEDMLVASIQAFEFALEERPRNIVPKDRAITQSNLAAVLQSLGQRNNDAKMLKRSVEAYKNVLLEWTRERLPLSWATTMTNMGTALRLLGEHRKGSRTLEQSVAAYNSALAEQERKNFPGEWAITQNNLGAALQKLAEREKNAETLVKAVAAYESALQEWTRERVPMTWAMTMANLGVARRKLAEVTEDIELASQAVEELEAVSEAFREASHAQYSELSIDQLAQARKLVDLLAVVS